MTREKILKLARPILFNTEDVRTILDDRKTVTRRVVKNADCPPAVYGRDHYSGLRNELNGDTTHLFAGFYNESDIFFIDGKKHIDAIYFKAPCKPGDYLYVRETWSPVYPDDTSNDVVGYMFRADDGMGVAEYDRRYPNGKDYYWPGIWCPSIHMPKEAARIFIRVKDVRVERLQEIDNVGALKEGCDGRCSEPADGALSDCQMDYDFSIEKFMTVWDSTIKPKDRGKYGWDANPYVFVIEFERVEVEE